MDKPFNHLIICLTFVMPVAALSGCSGPNDSPAMHVALVAGGHPYDFVMPAAAFRSGKEYVYTLKTAGNGVEIEDITITGWQPGGNYEGTITEKEQERQ